MVRTRIELRHLRYFAALAEELHFGRAAERCNISQPPFSVAIRQLETEVGFDLVDRASTPLRLTSAGVVFYEEVLRSLSQIDYAVESAGLVSKGMSGILRIGFFGSMLCRGLPKVLESFERERPGVEIRLVELNTREQVAALQRGIIDYGFLHTSAVPDTLACELIASEPFVLCVPMGHRLASAGGVRLAEAEHENFILFSRGVSPAYYDQLISVCMSSGFRPVVRHEVRHWHTAVSCVGRGLGVALVPASMHDARITGVAYVPIEDSPVQPQLWAAWSTKGAEDAALLAFHEAVKLHLFSGEGGQTPCGV